MGRSDIGLADVSVVDLLLPTAKRNCTVPSMPIWDKNNTKNSDGV